MGLSCSPVHQLDCVSSYSVDTVVVSNYNISEVDGRNRSAGGGEYQEEVWLFDPGNRVMFKPIGNNVEENRRSSPTFSALQYNLTVANNSETESEEEEEELSLENYQS